MMDIFRRIGGFFPPLGRGNLRAVKPRFNLGIPGIVGTETHMIAWKCSSQDKNQTIITTQLNQYI